MLDTLIANGAAQAGLSADEISGLPHLVPAAGETVHEVILVPLGPQTLLFAHYISELIPPYGILVGARLPPLGPGVQPSLPIVLRDGGAKDRLEITDFTRRLLQPAIEASRPQRTTTSRQQAAQTARDMAFGNTTRTYPGPQGSWRVPVLLPEPGQHRQAAQQAAYEQVDDRNDHSAMIPARQSGQAQSSNRAPQDRSASGGVPSGFARGARRPMPQDAGRWWTPGNSR